MRSLALFLLIFSFSPASHAFWNEMIPYPAEPQSERDVFYDLLPHSKWPCARVIENSGFYLWGSLEIRPTRLPPGIDRFRIVISVCDGAQRCRRVQSIEFHREFLNRLINSESIVEYGCGLKPNQKIEALRIDLIEDRPWYKTDRPLDAGLIRTSDFVSYNQMAMKTRLGTAEFQIDLK